jgi:hypothetical protein
MKKILFLSLIALSVFGSGTPTTNRPVSTVWLTSERLTQLKSIADTKYVTRIDRLANGMCVYRWKSRNSEWATTQTENRILGATSRNAWIEKIETAEARADSNLATAASHELALKTLLRETGIPSDDGTSNIALRIKSLNLINDAITNNVELDGTGIGAEEIAAATKDFVGRYVFGVTNSIHTNGMMKTRQHRK